MIKRVFNKILFSIKEYYKEFLAFILIWFGLTYNFPYYIDATGGAINVSDRIEVENKYISEGSFNMAYVSELPGKLVFLALAMINPNWDIVKYEDVLLENETKEDEFNRNRILLNESTNNAIKIAYNTAGSKVNVKDEKMIITFVLSEAKTDLLTGDQIISIDNNKVKSLSDIKQYVNSHKEGDKLEFKIIRDKKEMTAHAVIYEEDNELFVGIGASLLTELETEPKLKLNFEDSESGPSGGLMVSLAIYDSLIEYDLTRGLKIVGTGTMESDGTIGSIGGVKYKLAGAVKKNADLFFIPAGENYKEAMKIKKEKNYNIKIVPVEKFSDAVEYLMTLE